MLQSRVCRASRPSLLLTLPLQWILGLLGGDTDGQTQTGQRCVPCHRMSCSAVRGKREGILLGIALPTGDGEWWPLHHLFCLLLSSTSPSLIKQSLFIFYLDPQIYFAFILSSSSIPWGGKLVRSCVVLGCPPGLTTLGAVIHISQDSLGWFFGHSLPPLEFITLSYELVAVLRLK